MNRKTRMFLAGLASVSGAVVGAGVLHNRRPDRREHLHVTVFAEPGFTGRNETLTWTGGEREVVPLTKVRLPRIGSIRLERLVYRFQPEVRIPNLYILWHALTERPDRTDPEGGLASFIAINQLAGMFSAGLWEPVPESRARSRLRLWAGPPGHLLPANEEGGPSGKAAPGKVAASSGAAVPGTEPWHDVLANTPDLGSWSTRTRYLELGYHHVRGPRS